MRTMTFLALALASASAWAASPGSSGTKDDDTTGTEQPTTKDPSRDTTGTTGTTGTTPTGTTGQDKYGQMDPAKDKMGMHQDAAQLIRNWTEESRLAAQNVIDAYGQPDVVTEEFLVWKDNGPWKKTIVYKEGIAHSFPKPHKGVVEQSVAYQVPVDMYDDLAKFDGALTLDRNAGEMTVRSQNEAMNYLALNLANEIVTGKRTVEDARRYFAETANAFTSGQTDNEYTRGLMFDTKKDAMDKDRPFTGT